MWPTLFLGGALALGQPPAPGESPQPSTSPPVWYVAPAGPPGSLALTRVVDQPPPPAQPGGADPGNVTGEPLNVAVTAPKAQPAEAAAAAAATPADRWMLMRSLQGTWTGVLLDDNRTSVSGWVEGSYTASTNTLSNQPVVWNDRANRFLLNQAWVRVERSVVTSGTTEATWGYRIDTDIGSDYRFSMMRGLLNGQLESRNGQQNIYGVDLIQFYTNVYIPTLFEGTDVRVGRLFTPWGYESLEGISTPFVSRSYAFNWSPPFTHMGIMVSPTFSKQWAGKFMLANGNDVFFNAAQEVRSVGAITWTSLDKADSVTFGWSYGRGVMNTGNPFNPATTGEQSEPAGRNNINVADLVWAHTFNPKLSYATELIYGYQTNVPANVPGGIIDESRPAGAPGTAHWGSWVQYLNYVFSSKATGIVRFEMFDDFEGQRTGFEGLYTAITTGLQLRPVKSVLIRPELRYDYNGYNRPFENKHDIFTAAVDMIVRY